MCVSRDLINWTTPKLAPLVNLFYMGKGLQGELILAGMNQTGWTEFGEPRRASYGPKPLPPPVIIARSVDLQEYTMAEIHPHKKMPKNEVVSPRLAWYDPTTHKFHCVLYHGSWGASGVGEDKEWWQRLSEYVGTRESGLRFVRKLNEKIWRGQAILVNKQILLMTSERGSLRLFEGLSLKNNYKKLQLYPRWSITSFISDISRDGRLLCGVDHRFTNGDAVFGYEVDISKFLRGKETTVSAELGSANTKGK